MGAEARLAELGITVPEVVPPVAAYQPTARSGDLVFTAGQLPARDGEMIAVGKLGGEVSEKDRDFYEGKVAAAQFFARNVLPKVAAERQISDSVDLALMELPESAF